MKTVKKSWWGPLILILLAVIAFIVAMLAIPAIELYKFSRASKRNLITADAGFKKATNTIDPEALRKWALDNIRNKRSFEEITNTMPDSIRNLYDFPPEDVSVDGSTLSLFWGGTWFRWGFYIGETNAIMPFHSADTELPYNFEWRPGIYYTREANMPLQ